MHARLVAARLRQAYTSRVRMEPVLGPRVPWGELL